MADVNNSVSTAQLANRRGFLLGITLAEILLITLFVLLLLFRHYQDKADIADDVIEVLGEDTTETLISASGGLPPPNQAMKDRIADITEKLIDCRARELPECRGGDISEDELMAVGEKKPQPESLDEAKEEIEKLSRQLARTREDLLTEKRKTGEKPFCTYLPPEQGSLRTRGRNVSIGTFHIEKDGITLVARDRNFERNEFVDIVGESYDGGDAIESVSAWPLCKKLSFEEFAERGAEFVEIGDREAEKRKACRFGADFFYNPSEETDRAREKVFEEYFFKGSNRLVSAEFLSRKRAFCGGSAR